ncbi:glycosyltransferase family 4 protein [Arthrobacter bambusae]|uniref:Glycosyltransferase involved in cell wall biosynthesis n=1 Tax=Arthrobacter bambusae TaxID=1338426 RepID=A0AAW8DCN0_9MICC|nr:glycosyltransferase family 4 protein [Arthrobacter bambusae]MDP9903651.1 glycosyltransferase involved in cell wall biosynthesis [Arthrobacter bambusae]MDQ0128355.1 glycosyltransferase involved in cell wall biosynthesis [Arthrobacter bambusae]MDQ0179696.1 glycosyltransferase involved in cell wall biosynthesis [Arthrobacter bambusae]
MVSKYREFHGGVESHILDLIAGLSELGHRVELFSSEDVPGDGFDARARGLAAKVRSVGSLFWNSAAREALAAAIEKFEPDLVHYHSIYHQLSPSVLDISSVPSIMTLHDYKLVAPCYSLYRDSQICTDCVGRKFALPAVLNRCVKGSAIASVVCAAEQVIYKSRYIDSVDRFIVPSSFLRQMLVESGIPEERMTVVPWGVPANSPETVLVSESPANGSKFVLYAGRLHESKGLGQLLDAWTGLVTKEDYKLIVVGGGSLEPSVRAAVASDPSVEYLGVIDRGHLLDLVSMAEATVMPSIVPETMGLSALESLVRGTPALLTGRGALSELSGAGTVDIDPDALVESLAEALSRIVRDPSFLAAKRAELAKRDLSMYTRDAMVGRIVDIYKSTLLASSGSHR